MESNRRWRSLIKRFRWSHRNRPFDFGSARKEKRGHHMQERLYDLIFIVRPATPEDEIKKVLSVVEHTCAEKGGKIEKTEHWGTRKLAYRVAKHREGIYVHQEIRTTHGELIAELERRLRVQDPVIKYQTVRLDEDLKRQKKLSQKREKRAARRPRRTTTPTPVAPEQTAAAS